MGAQLTDTSPGHLPREAGPSSCLGNTPCIRIDSACHRRLRGVPSGHRESLYEPRAAMLSPTIIASIERDIITATDDGTAIPLATAHVAERWCRRREERGASPASVTTTAAVIFQVGAELAA